MILVREVFQLKYGKAKEAKALFKDATELAKKYDMPAGRGLTDLTGRYYTFVWESTHKSVADWEASTKDTRGAEEWGSNGGGHDAIGLRPTRWFMSIHALLAARPMPQSASEPDI